jgi:hypothetical protein
MYLVKGNGWSTRNGGRHMVSSAYESLLCSQILPQLRRYHIRQCARYHDSDLKLCEGCVRHAQQAVPSLFGPTIPNHGRRTVRYIIIIHRRSFHSLGDQCRLESSHGWDSRRSSLKGDASSGSKYLGCWCRSKVLALAEGGCRRLSQAYPGVSERL